MEATHQFPARLHVLFAKDAPDAVVIRRGPSKSVCTVGWNRDNDTFKVGQWLNGRIYERRSDLSPDGKHLIYFALNGDWESESKGSWTALSRTPYLKALGFWPKGDTWHGGGLFLDKRRYWLNQGCGQQQVREPQGLRKVELYPNYVYYGGECTRVYYLRLLRDGWTLKESGDIAKHRDVAVFEKRITDAWVLRKFAHATTDSPMGKGCYYDEHEIENSKTGQKIDGNAWEWADVDRNRLAWAQDGKIFAARVLPEGMGELTELHDFNAMSFEPIAAPY